MHSENNTGKILTKRSLEYLTLAGLGFGNEEIAYILSVSKSTVKEVLKKSYFKLKAINRSNAILIAYLNNIINAKLCNEILDKYPNAKTLLDKKKHELENTKKYAPFNKLSQ